MPAYYHIDPLIGCIMVTLEGVVTDADLLIGQRQMHSDELFRGSYPRLVDATNVTRLAVTAETVRSIAKYAVAHGLSRAALVADSDVTYAIMRMYEGYAYGADCYVSRNMHEALAWLTKQPHAAADA